MKQGVEVEIKHWSGYVPPNAPQEPDKSIEPEFRLAQLLRKRTFLSVNEAMNVTRRVKTTIEQNFRDLDKARLIKRIERDGWLSYSLAPTAGWAVGVVAERHRVVAMGFTADYGVIDSHEPVEVSIPSKSPPTAVLEATAKAVRDVMAYRWSGELLGVGLAVPFPVDNQGVCRTRVAGLWQGSQPAVNLQQLLGPDDDGNPIAVAIDNDASLGALGVYLNRLDPNPESKSPTDLAYVRVADGIGLGLVLKGKFVRGGHGMAGELSHRPIDGLIGATCRRCGRACLESVASGRAIEERLQTGPTPTLKQPLPKLIADYEALDPDDQAVLRHEIGRAGFALGKALASVVAAADPELVVIGGPLSASPPSVQSNGATAKPRTSVTARSAMLTAVKEGLGEYSLPFADGDEEVLPVIEMAQSPRTPIPRPELRGAAAMVVQRHADAWLWWRLQGHARQQPAQKRKRRDSSRR